MSWDCWSGMVERNNRGIRVCDVESQQESRGKEGGGRKWKNTKQQAQLLVTYCCHQGNSSCLGLTHCGSTGPQPGGKIWHHLEKASQILKRNKYKSKIVLVILVGVLKSILWHISKYTKGTAIYCKIISMYSRITPKYNKITSNYSEIIHIKTNSIHCQLIKRSKSVPSLQLMLFRLICQNKI